MTIRTYCAYCVSVGADVIVAGGRRLHAGSVTECLRVASVISVNARGLARLGKQSLRASRVKTGCLPLLFAAL